MEQLFVGILMGFVLGVMIIGFLWNESTKGEND
jgi:hypothetical protein